MTNRGAWTGTVNPGDKVTIPAGYHNGSGYVSANDGAPSVTKIISNTSSRSIDIKPYASNYSNLTINNFKLQLSYTEVNVSNIDTARPFVDSTGGSGWASYNASTGTLTWGFGLGNNLGSGKITLVLKMDIYLIQ